MQTKLFYENPYLQEFRTNVLHTGVEANGIPFVVLEETAFYPTGGGQPCDLGTIHDIPVVEVEEVDGDIRHRLRDALPEGITEVTGVIDWDRRFDHMQQHTGQHILSASFDDLFGAPTVGFHLGSERVTIDIATQDLTQEMADKAETLANMIVFENRPISAQFVSEQEIAKMTLRKTPTVTENIRIVAIQDFDYNPCGGTHPAHTGEVGPIKILNWERNKGNVRIEFLCGKRTIVEMSKKQQLLREMSRLLLSSETELPNHVQRLLTEKKELEQVLQNAEKKLLAAEANELLASAETLGEHLVISSVFAERPMQSLQKLAQQITSLSPSAICLFASSGAKIQLLFARGSESNLPMNELLKETLLLIEGKGGGNPSMAQGGGSASLPAEELLQQTIGRIKEK